MSNVAMSAEALTVLLKKMAPKVEGFSVDVLATHEALDGACRVRITLSRGVGPDMVYWWSERHVPLRAFIDAKSFQETRPLRDLEELQSAFKEARDEGYQKGVAAGILQGRAAVLDPLRAVGEVLAEAFRGGK